MASVASQLIQEVTAHSQSVNVEDAREICADGTYFPNNLRMQIKNYVNMKSKLSMRLHLHCPCYHRRTPTLLPFHWSSSNLWDIFFNYLTFKFKHRSK